jgi:hypothetical protein
MCGAGLAALFVGEPGREVAEVDMGNGCSSAAAAALLSRLLL